METVVGFFFIIVLLHWLASASTSPFRELPLAALWDRLFQHGGLPLPPPLPPTPPPVQPNYRFLVRDLTGAAHRVLDSYFREAAASYGAATSEAQAKTYAELKQAADVEIATEMEAYIDALENLARQDPEAVEAEFQRLWNGDPKGRDVMALGLAQKHYRALRGDRKVDRKQLEKDFHRNALG